MAELLVKVSDNVHKDATKDLRGSYKRGDILEIRDNGFAWGRIIRSRRWYLIKVPDVSADSLREFTLAHNEPALDPLGTLVDDLGRTRRRRYHLKLGDLPAGKRGELGDRNGTTLTNAEFRTVLFDKPTDTRVP